MWFPIAYRTSSAKLCRFAALRMNEGAEITSKTDSCAPVSFLLTYHTRQLCHTRCVVKRSSQEEILLKKLPQR
jgi:hypothetical protein